MRYQGTPDIPRYYEGGLSLAYPGMSGIAGIGRTRYMGISKGPYPTHLVYPGIPDAAYPAYRMYPVGSPGRSTKNGCSLVDRRFPSISSLFLLFSGEFTRAFQNVFAHA